MSRRRAAWALGVYCALLGVLVFSPVGPSLGGVPLLPEMPSSVVEAAANAAVFLPLGFLVAQLMRRGREWAAVVLCFLVSGGIEILQTLITSTRLSSPRDVLMNTAGAFIGAVCCHLVRRFQRRPSRKPLSIEGDPVSPSPSST